MLSCRFDAIEAEGWLMDFLLLDAEAAWQESSGGPFFEGTAL